MADRVVAHYVVTHRVARRRIWDIMMLAGHAQGLIGTVLAFHQCLQGVGEVCCCAAWLQRHSQRTASPGCDAVIAAGRVHR